MTRSPAKQVGGATGLELSFAYGIAQRHKDHLRVAGRARQEAS